jgi:hypothetical protein
MTEQARDEGTLIDELHELLRTRRANWRQPIDASTGYQLLGRAAALLSQQMANRAALRQIEHDMREATAMWLRQADTVSIEEKGSVAGICLRVEEWAERMRSLINDD